MPGFFSRGNNSSSDDSDSSDDESLISSDDEQQQQGQQNAGGKKDMHKMFMKKGAGGSDSSSEEDSDEDDDDSDDQGPVKPSARANAFLKGASSDEDSDEDDERKVVKSAKDKRLDEVEATIKTIENAAKINDWVAISNDFDKLIRLIQRHQTLTSTLSPAAQNPPMFVKSLVDLDALITAAAKREKDAKKKMNAANAKGLNGMKQKIKKTLRDFDAAVQAYNTDSAAFEEAYTDATTVVSAKDTAAAERATRKAAADAAAGEGTQAEDFMTVGRGGRALNLTSEGVFKTLKSIMESRGKKNTDRAETIKILQKLIEVAASPYQRIRVLLALVSARLDYSTNLASMPHDSWCSALGELNQLITMLLAPENVYVVTEDAGEYDDMVERAPGQGEEKDNATVKVRGSLINLLESVDSEFTKTLQHTDQHGSEYVERLREEKPLYETIVKAQILFERQGWEDPTGRAVIRRLEHVYSKPAVVVDVLERAAVKSLQGQGQGQSSSQIADVSAPQAADDLVYALAVYLYRSAPALLRTRAMLCHIYHNAMIGRYHEARDMLLMSHLQDNIQHADIATQILYNRTVVQLGLAAFKRGYIQECQSTLNEIFSSQRAKELLAQGTQRYSQTSPEQEALEKRRLLPFHMHVNLDLVETAYLVSCMLIELPLLASLSTDEEKRKAVSRPFRRLLEQADRQTFMGAPESARDHIMQASKAMRTGDWERARDLILSMKLWSLLDDSKAITERLAKQIQEQSLRTYLFTYAPYYDSLSFDLLAQTFSLPRRSVVAIASKMIWSDELPASLDQIDGVIVFHRTEQTRVQQLAQELANKAEALVEQNEKLLDSKTGSERADGGRDRGEGGRGRGDRRGRGGYRGRGQARARFERGTATKVEA
ncbi:Translation initiation factor 3 subunit c [Naganishia albida]|nr:Translation initiation factor 3 subunit c [Naganishia albida]